jgi:D-glycero-alpha-D-manno-heptose-7-phosphate kinase
MECENYYWTGYRMLIISKSPVRISYAGGGSDYYPFFQEHGGCVVNATIDKYVYFFSLPQWPLAEDRFRFTYRKTESVSNFKLLEHPVLRQLLKNLDWAMPLNIATMADVPGESGLGSSSAFTAAAIQNLNFRLGISVNGAELAGKAIEIEREQLREPGGWQDQIATAHGGFQSYRLNKNGFESHNLNLSSEVKDFLKARQILVATEFKRKNASAAQTIQDTANNILFPTFKESANIARKLEDSLKTSSNSEFAYSSIVSAVTDYWEIKKTLPMDPDFHSILNERLRLLSDIGVDGFKLLGSGNGGYILVLASPKQIDEVENVFGKEKCIRFSYSDSGTNTEGSDF